MKCPECGAPTIEVTHANLEPGVQYVGTQAIEEAVADERARIAAWLPRQRVTAEVLGLTGLAVCIARGDHAQGAAARRPIEDARPDETTTDPLPPAREHDDFEEGKFLVEGGRFRRGVTGRLRDG